MYLPVGEPIRFNTQAQDVIHSFYVREFLLKRDAFPDHVNTFDLDHHQAGDYGGHAHRASRAGPPGDAFHHPAVPRAQYEAWLVKAKKEAASGWPGRRRPALHRGYKDVALQQGLPCWPR